MPLTCIATLADRVSPTPVCLAAPQVLLRRNRPLAHCREFASDAIGGVWIIQRKNNDSHHGQGSGRDEAGSRADGVGAATPGGRPCGPSGTPVPRGGRPGAGAAAGRCRSASAPSRPSRPCLPVIHRGSLCPRAGRGVCDDEGLGRVGERRRRGLFGVDRAVDGGAESRTASLQQVLGADVLLDQCGLRSCGAGQHRERRCLRCELGTPRVGVCVAGSGGLLDSSSASVQPPRTTWLRPSIARSRAGCADLAEARPEHRGDQALPGAKSGRRSEGSKARG
jgi:hypothetical protein